MGRRRKRRSHEWAFHSRGEGCGERGEGLATKSYQWQLFKNLPEPLRDMSPRRVFLGSCIHIHNPRKLTTRYPGRLFQSTSYTPRAAIKWVTCRVTMVPEKQQRASRVRRWFILGSKANVNRKWLLRSETLPDPVPRKLASQLTEKKHHWFAELVFKLFCIFLANKKNKFWAIFFFAFWANTV